MTITYVNHVETITDSLRYLLVQEFNCDIVHGSLFEPEHLTRGEYFRYYLDEQPVLESFTTGETRDYIFDCAWYFDSKHRDFKKTFDDLVSERIERLKRLLNNNRHYRPSDVYKWHTLKVETQQSFYLGEELDEDSYNNILCAPLTITITRSDING